jgi:uncharacterized protein YndB with AHSA1/START domain
VRLQVEQEIDAAPSDVFRFVATDHFTNHPTWDPAVLEMTPTTPGPLRPGTTARVVRGDRGKRTEGRLTVTDYEPDQRFAATTEFGPFRLRQRVTCAPTADGGTRLTLAIETRARGPFRVLLPLLRRRFLRTMRSSLQTIARHVEVGP